MTNSDEQLQERLGLKFRTQIAERALTPQLCRSGVANTGRPNLAAPENNEQLESG